MRKSPLFPLLSMATLLLGLTGCDDGYSDQIMYEVRTDPFRTAKTKSILPEEPDRPGQLPLLKMSDLDNPNNPFYLENKKESFLDSELFGDPTLASDKDRDSIRDSLDELFGTPALPTVGSPGYTDLKKDERELLKLSDETLARGSKLYRIQCLHCHGVTGDGRGPTARWVNPHPRDYRQGRFKFQSVDLAKARTPTREDLMRTLEVGIEGTAMPAFGLLPTEDREALVSYVIHLSLRGKTEYDVFKDSFVFKKKEKVLVYEDPERGSIKLSIKKAFLDNVKEWVVSQDPKSQIEIGPYPARLSDLEEFKKSVLRGKQLFLDPSKLVPPARVEIKESCVTCHIEYGRRSTFRLDDWGTLAKPNNLTVGVFRGGRRPIDIYRRIHSGIQPSGMIQFSNLGNDDIWNLVNFVQVVGNPTMRKKLDIYVD